MSGLVTPDFVFVGLNCDTPVDVFSTLGGELHSHGLVTGGYVDALSAREEKFPTGLPVGCGVAIPHTDAKYVNEDRIVVATLAKPVEFGAMGGGDPIAVSLVLMLVLSPARDHLGVLQRVIKAIQDNSFLEQIVSLTDADEIASLAEAAFDKD